MSMTHFLFAMCLALATSRQVPANIAASLADAPEPLTSVVVADIDRDGDADVVATDGALHLFVWLNDGTGRLTQQQPAAPDNRCAGPDRPNVERGATRADASAPTDPPTMEAHGASATEVPLICTTAVRAGGQIDRDRPRSTRALRGPPAADSSRV
jgi:hypothetical protein